LDILHLSIRILLSWLISGSFGISGTELATIASLLLPITIIQFNNGSFGWMKMLQRLYYDKWYLGFDFTNTMDTAGIAEAFGLRCVRIPDPDHLSPVMTEALASNEPLFIDIPTKLITPVQAYSMLKDCCSA
jgi:acetolactate synthase-1/2/3 large subunit